MKQKIIKLVTLIAFLMGGFSCADDSDEYRFPWDGSQQQEEFRPINPGTKTSSFAIDGNIISFAVPYLVGTTANEHPSLPNYGNSEGFSPRFWTILLVMTKGTDVTKLAPIVTLTPGAKITMIYNNAQGFKYVDYTGIAEIGAIDFSKQVDIRIDASDGSTVSYNFLAVAIGDDLGPCSNCP